MTSIAVAGDFFVAPGSRPSIGPRLEGLLAGCDQALVNFEGPIAPGLAATFKSGPSIRQDPDAAGFAREMGFTVACLANNHILDYGSSGLQATVEACAQVDIATVGWDSGETTGGAVELAGLNRRVAIVNVCEAEWVRSPEGSGATVFSPVRTGRVVRAAAADGQEPVVVLHGGNEYFPYPNPELRDAARFMIECGAAAVLMHHSHVVAGYEYWQGRPIAYGLGNFQFIMPSPRHDWFEGAVALLRWEGGGGPVLELLPTVVDRRTFTVELAFGRDHSQATNLIQARSQVLASDASLAAHWQQFLQDSAAMYLRTAMPAGASRQRLLSGASARFWRRYARSHPEELAYLLNVARCDSHRVALTGVLEDLMPR